MLKPLAKTAAALSLIYSASFSIPALAGSSVDDRKCTGAKHQQSKWVTAAPIRNPHRPKARRWSRSESSTFRS